MAEIYFIEKNISVKESRPMCYVVALVCENLWSKPYKPGSLKIRPFIRKAVAKSVKVFYKVNML